MNTNPETKGKTKQEQGSAYASLRLKGRSYSGRLACCVYALSRKPLDVRSHYLAMPWTDEL
jgi:hypothetical protein